MTRWDDDTIREGELKEMLQKYSKWLDKHSDAEPYQNLINFSAQLTPIEAKILSEVLFELRKGK